MLPFQALRMRTASGPSVVTGAPQLVASQWATTTNQMPGTISVAYPSGRAIGDIALLYVSGLGNGSTSYATPAGWTQVRQDQANLVNLAHALFWRRLDGTESGSVSVSVTGSATFAGLGSVSFMSVWRGCVSTGTPVEDAGDCESYNNTATGSMGAKSRLASGADRTIVHHYFTLAAASAPSAAGTGFTLGDVRSGGTSGAFTYRSLTNPAYAGEEVMLGQPDRWGSIYVSLIPETIVSGSTATMVDPNFDKVVFLSGFETPSGTPSGAFEIINPARGLVAAGSTGAANLDTTQKKFGSASLRSNVRGFTSVDSADWAFGSGAFTIECWVRFNTAPTTGIHHLIAQYDTGANQRSWTFQVNAGNIALVLSPDGSSSSTKGSAAWAPSTATWYHIAADWDGTNYRTYVDGVMKGKSATGVTLLDSTAALTIGTALNSGAINTAFDGWIDEVRITKGVARYASDSGYTTPTAAFPRG